MENETSPYTSPVTDPSPDSTELATLSKDEKMWGMFGHLSGLLGYSFVPLANIIAPLVIWQVKKDTMPFAAEQAKESLNFQISMTIYILVGMLSLFILIGFLLVPLLVLAGVVFTIIASLKANEGTPYKYPFTLRFIK